jgi:hypothetical protein
LSSFLLAVLVPGLSVVLAAVAIRRGVQAKSALGGEWNPADRHLWWGFRLAYCGELMSLTLTPIVFLYLILYLISGS